MTPNSTSPHYGPPAGASRRRHHLAIVCEIACFHLASVVVLSQRDLLKNGSWGPRVLACYYPLVVLWYHFFGMNAAINANSVQPL